MDLILLSDAFWFQFQWALVAECSLERVWVRIRGFSLRTSGEG